MSGRDDAELARLRQRVADFERRELIAQAERIAPGVDLPAHSTDSEVRAIAVRSAHGVEAIADASDDEIRGMFRALVQLSNEDPVRRALRVRPQDVRH